MRKRPYAQVRAWNAAHKIGTPVEYRRDNGSIMRTATRTRAEVLGGHTAVVWIEGVAGCVDLDRVTPVQEQREPDYKALAKRLSNALLTVAPLGGSECFIRIGDDYFADPEWFKQRIRENRERLHEALKQAALAKK